MTNPSIASDLIERLRKRLDAEAARRNSAYDRFGMDNTPQSVDPDVFAAAEALEQLTREVDELREAAERGLEWTIDAANESKGPGDPRFDNAMKDIRFIEEALSRSSGRVSDAAK